MRPAIRAVAFTVAIIHLCKAQVPCYRQCRLHEAARTSNLVDIRNFLFHGDDIDERNSAGDTPLLVAIRQAQPRALNLLLDKGARQLVDQTGLTPLHVAASIGNAHAAEALIAAGADVAQLHAADGLTPLHRAAIGGFAETITVLVGAGADPDEPTFPPYDLKHRFQQPLDLAKGAAAAAQLRYFLNETWRRPAPFWCHTRPHPSCPPPIGTRGEEVVDEGSGSGDEGSGGSGEDEVGSADEDGGSGSGGSAGSGEFTSGEFGGSGSG